MNGQLAVRCPHCGTRPPRRCTPHGEHLARYIEAFRLGHLPKATLTAAVAEMTVIAAHVLVPTASEKAA